MPLQVIGSSEPLRDHKARRWKAILQISAPQEMFCDLLLLTDPHSEALWLMVGWKKSQPADHSQK